MKTLILFLALLGGAQAQTAHDKTYLTTTATSLNLTKYSTASAYAISFQCGLSISMSTGTVTIPKGMTLDAASVEFWKAIEIAYPHTLGKRYTADEADDVVKSLKLLLDYADPARFITVDAVYRTEAAQLRMAADRAEQKEKDIAWARTILAKWEARAK